MILTTSINLHCAQNSKDTFKLQIAFKKMRDEYNFCHYSESNITMLKLLGIAVISACSCPWFADDYKNLHATLTLAAFAHRLYAMREDEQQTRKKIIKQSANKFSWKYLKNLKQHYEKNSDYDSEIFLNEVLKEKEKLRKNRQ